MADQSNEMVERVQAAVYAKWAEAEGTTTTWQEVCDMSARCGYFHAKKAHRMIVDMARAAIEALRVPTEAMKTAALEKLGPVSGYTAAIDAALSHDEVKG